MKSITLLTTLVLGLCVSAHAALSFSYTASPGATIPDGNLSGWSSTVSLDGLSSSYGPITDVQVSLNISGGYNGDLYAYLSYDGKLLPLLTRIGYTGSDPFGNSAAGMTVTLSDGGSANIHDVTGAATPSGTYLADGLALGTSSPYNPVAGTPATFYSTYGGMTLDPSKQWTLFLADVSGGGGAATLNSWSVTVTAVPEPINVALAVFGLCAVGVGAGRRYLAKAKNKA